MTRTIDVVVPNIVEFNLRQLGATLDPHTTASFMAVGAGLADESVFWSTERRVLVLHPGTDMAWFADVHGALGLTAPSVISPSGSGLLVGDLLTDGDALRDLHERVDGSDHIRLLSWGATPELYRLAGVLRGWGATVTLDVPAPEDYWTSLYLDSKISCLDLASRIPGFRVPPGFTTMSWEETRGTIRTVLSGAPAAIVKSLHSVGGIGAAVVRADPDSRAAFWLEVAHEPLLHTFPLVVQEFVTHAPELGCPAVDLLVGDGGVEEIVTSVMSVEGHRFRSVKVGAGILPREVAEESLAIGLRVGEEARRIGFCGWLGVDYLVGTDGVLYVTEINARRTGGMHPIVLARRWGIDQTVVRYDSAHPVPSQGRWSYRTDLRPIFREYWRTGERILPTTVRCLSRRRPSLGVVTAGATPADSEALAAEFSARVATAGGAVGALPASS